MITPSDIMYEDDLVRILRPETKKGVLVFSSYKIPIGMADNVKEVGLKTGKRLHEEGFNTYFKVFHPHIFFRAPWFSREIDYSTHETEIVSSFGQGHMDINNRCFIRVDPDKTFVFSSCIREEYCQINYKNAENVDAELVKSKKTISEYLKILAYNRELYKTVYPISITKKQPAYHLYTSELIVFPNNGNWIATLEYPLSVAPIELNSEVLVSLPHLTPDYFVRCT